MSLIRVNSDDLQLVPLTFPPAVASNAVVLRSGGCPLCRRPFVVLPTHHGSETAPPHAADPHNHHHVSTDHRRYFKALPPPPTFVDGRGESGGVGRDPMLGSSEDISVAEEDEAQGYYAQHFEEVCRVGRGAFGSVHVCRHVVGGEVVGIFAVKKIPVGNDALYLRKVLAEVKMLERVSHHPNIVQYHHSWLDHARTSDFGPKVRCLFILMEYAPHGSLEQLIDKCAASLSDDGVWYLFLSVLRGLGHLHEHGILHRDIKADNVLLVPATAAPTELDPSGGAAAAPSGGEGANTISGPRAPRPVLADFGTSAAIINGMTDEEALRLAKSRTGVTGTLEYMAPEISEAQLKQPTPKCVHSVQSDLFAMGVLLHRLAFGGSWPLRTADETQPGAGPTTFLPNVTSTTRPHVMQELVVALLQSDPKRRPTSCAAILSLPQVAAKWRQVSHLSLTQLVVAPTPTSPPHGFASASSSALSPLLLLPSCAPLLALPPSASRLNKSMSPEPPSMHRGAAGGLVPDAADPLIAFTPSSPRSRRHGNHDGSTADGAARWLARFVRVMQRRWRDLTGPQALVIASIVIAITALLLTHYTTFMMRETDGCNGSSDLPVSYPSPGPSLE